MTRLCATLLVGGFALGGCSEDNASPRSATPMPGEGVVLPDGRTFSRSRLLADAAACIASELSLYRDRTQHFDAVSASLAEKPDWSQAQLAWADAIDVWQRLELMQVGPLATTASPGGQGLRDQIYSWPLARPCKVDEVVVDGSFVDANFSKSLVTGRGLDAAEYLLFHDGTDSACAAESQLIVSGAWASLTPSALRAQRGAYASAVARDATHWANTAHQAWGSADGQGFLAELALAGQGSRTFKNSRLALNALSDALFYIEWATKDTKVAVPAGLNHCPSPTCPEALESRYAKRSRRHILNNLQGFRLLFTGCSAAGLGFDDYLVAVGANALATDLNQAWVSAEQAAAALPEQDLAESLLTNVGPMLELHQALKGITDLLRTEFVSVLDLELPTRVEGDND